jgi:hypothetical protein
MITMIYNLCIKQGRAGASPFVLGDGELNVRDDELASSSVAGLAREHWGKSRTRDGLGPVIPKTPGFWEIAGNLRMATLP